MDEILLNPNENANARDSQFTYAIVTLPSSHKQRGLTLCDIYCDKDACSTPQMTTAATPCALSAISMYLALAVSSPDISKTIDIM